MEIYGYLLASTALMAILMWGFSRLISVGSAMNMQFVNTVPPPENTVPVQQPEICPPGPGRFPSLHRPAGTGRAGGQAGRG